MNKPKNTGILAQKCHIHEMDEIGRTVDYSFLVLLQAQDPLTYWIDMGIVSFSRRSRSKNILQIRRRF